MEPRKTPLYDSHVKLGGKMVEFAGFLMPVQYGGIVEEHRAVRRSAGVFDVSHMGEFTVSGDRALEYLNAVTTNDVAALEPFQVQYSAMLNDEGGVIDDLVLYRRDSDYLLVVNAANTARDFEWLSGRLHEGVELKNISDAIGQIAVQGPQAEGIVAPLAADDISGLGYYHSMNSSVAGVPCLVSRTGYTGEDGFEIYADAARTGEIWDAVLASDAGPVPCGLGARDTLRLEMAFRLHGSDMDETTTPLEAGLGWIVKMDKGDFTGRDVLARQREEGLKRRLVGLMTQTRRFPRPGFKVRAGDEEVGAVTSGGFSPSLECGIALAYVARPHAKKTSDFSIDVRGEKVKAEYVKGPFYKEASHK
ncbi:MAG: glycine cleavage system aminomethyltransferase GcvT [bacterium]